MVAAAPVAIARPRRIAVEGTPRPAATAARPRFGPVPDATRCDLRARLLGRVRAMFRLCVLLSSAVLLLAACGGDDDGGSSGSSSSSASTAQSTSTATSGGNAESASAQGKQVFTQNCAGCHTLKDAGTNGQVGPNLDDLKPDKATVQRQVENGGGSMPAFKGQLSDAQIQAISQYVASVAGK